MKESIKLHKCVDPTIGVGDTVYIHDGSSLSIKGVDKPYIVMSYDIFGVDINVKHIPLKVVKTKCKRVLVSHHNWCYLQDIKLKSPNGTTLRVASKHVMKAPFEMDAEINDIRKYSGDMLI